MYTKYVTYATCDAQKCATLWKRLSPKAAKPPLPYWLAISLSPHNTSVCQNRRIASPFAILWHWFIVITLVVFDKPLSVN